MYVNNNRMYFKPILMFFLIIAIKFLTAESSCTNPNGEKGDCIPLYNCSALLYGLFHELAGSIDFARESNCGGTAKDPLVCCGSTYKWDPPTSTTVKPQKSLLPDSRFCGCQHSDDYFHEDATIALSEYPWMVRLRLNTLHDNVTRFHCSGSIINNRYVLTTATCANVTAKLRGIRLGQYDAQNATACTGNEDSFECTDPVQDIDVEKILLYTDEEDGIVSHDIALLRLKKTIRYSDYIRPICLHVDGSNYDADGQVLTASGWGLTDLWENLADIKKKTYHKIVSNEECAEIFGSAYNVTANHLCAVQLKNNTEVECMGDAGGPLMFSHRAHWHQEGILSVGDATNCNSSIPNIYIRVSKFMEWIEDNLEPW